MFQNLEKPHQCTNMHDFAKFNINHINLILLVSLQINAVCLYVPANERIIQTNANNYTSVSTQLQATQLHTTFFESLSTLIVFSTKKPQT